MAEIQKTVPFYFVFDTKTMKYRKTDDEWVNSFHQAMRHQDPEAAKKVKDILTKKGYKDLSLAKHTLMLTLIEETEEEKAYMAKVAAKKTNGFTAASKESVEAANSKDAKAAADAKKAYFAKQAYFKKKREGNVNGK